MTKITTAMMETTDESFTDQEYKHLRRSVMRYLFVDGMRVTVDAMMYEDRSWQISAEVKDHSTDKIAESFTVHIANITDEEREAIESECLEEAMENAVAAGWKLAA